MNVESPEIKAKRAALPTPEKVAQVKKWLTRLKSMPPEAVPMMPLEDDDVVAYMKAAKERSDKQQQQQQRSKADAAAAAAAKKPGGKQQKADAAAAAAPVEFDWRKVAKFDNAVVLELLNELAQGKEEEHIDEEEDELKYGALTRAISRFDERPSQCFSRDILQSILEVAADCHTILKDSVFAGREANAPGQDASAATAAAPAASASTAAAAAESKKASRPPLNALLMKGSTNHVMLSKLQCYCVMACSFLGIFPRANRDCTDVSGRFPSINLADMYQIATLRSVGPIVNVEKLLMFFEYFAESSKRYRSKDPRMTSPQFALIFTRGMTPDTIPPNFDHDIFRAAPMQDLQVLNLRESIDEQKATIRVDFANAIVGGASLSFGCVQEEIMFAECPEMNVSRWLCPEMEANEAVLILRGEQFSSHAGYAHSLTYQGPHRDGDGDILASAVLALDALDYRYLNPGVQYGEKGIRREFYKLCAGLAACAIAEEVYGVQLPSTITTGNWGCGVFRGDAELKAIIQWLVFSVHGMKTLYAPFDNAPLLSRLRDTSICCAARKSKLTAADVGAFLMGLAGVYQRGQSVLELFAAHFKLDLSMAGESLHRPPQRRGG